MLERFTQKARDVVTNAQEEARRLGQAYVGTEHLLAAMAAGAGLAHDALAAAGLTADAVRTEIAHRTGGPGRLGEGDAEALATIGIDLDAVVESVERSFGPGALTGSQPVKQGHLPFTKRAKKVLELALREALRLGHSYLGTEHLLLGMVREHDGMAMQILRDRGVDVAAVRARLEAAMPAGRPVKARAGTTGAGAQHILAVAGSEARRAGRRYIGTGQLLFALASLATEYDAGPKGKAVAKLLIESGLTAEHIRSSADDVPGESRPLASGIGLGDHLTKHAKAALGLARRLSLAERRVETDPEFILLALAMAPGSTAATLLLARGLTPKLIRDRLLPPPPSGVRVAA